jgi:hypothetical protein
LPVSFVEEQANPKRGTSQGSRSPVLEKHGFQGISRWPSFNKLNREDAVKEFFLHGFCPDQPVIRKSNRITAFGSCFAGNVSRYLHQRGYEVNAHNWKHANSDLIRIDEIMVHTPALLAQFEWAFDGKPLPNLIVDNKNTELKTYHVEEKVRDIIVSSNVFIVTFGLTEAWYDNCQKCYLWKFVPRKNMDPNRYVNKTISFAENRENIEKIYRLIRDNCPNACIIFTLSPIPLLGTYSGKAMYPANEVSKSRLRVAIDEFCSDWANDNNLFYFPSYELVKYFLKSPWKDDNRHITEEAVNEIMTLFETYFCEETN